MTESHNTETLTSGKTLSLKAFESTERRQYNAEHDIDPENHFYYNMLL